MGGIRLVLMAVVIMGVSNIMGGEWVVGAQVHHVVGGDRGWDSSSDLSSWSSDKFFRVGDHIWFGFEAPQESVVELQTLEQFLSCDVANPIKMYTDGLNKISLEEEGIRYFASGNPENCKNGLKLHVKVHPQDMDETLTVGSSSNGTVMVEATGPTPSTSAHLNGLPYLLCFGLLLFSTVLFN